MVTEAEDGADLPSERALAHYLISAAAAIYLHQHKAICVCNNVNEPWEEEKSA